MNTITLHLRRNIAFSAMLIFLTAKSLYAQQPSTAAAYPFVASNKIYTPITGTAPSLSGGGADDGYINNIPIGFPFVFAGTTYTTVTMSTNGLLTFGNISTAPWTNDLSNAASVVPCVWALWDDHYSYISSSNSSYSSNMSYTTTGAAGNRVFTAQWYAVDPRYAYIFSLSFQIKLYEDGGIECIYKHENSSGGTFSSATIGIAKSTSDWQTLPTSGTSPTPSTSTFTSSITAAPANGQSYYWGIQKKGFNNASANAVTAPVAPFCSGNQTVQVRVKNAGKNQINNVTVNWIVDGVPQTPVTYSTVIDTLGGTGGNFATVTLGTVNFGNAPRTIKIYTSDPNGQADTVNTDDTTVITMRSSPLANITAAGPTVYCGGGVINTLLNASTGTGYTYRWKLNGNNIVPAATGASYTATAAGDYTVQVDSGACSNTSPILRIDNLAMPQPTVTPATSANFCDNDSVQISANANIAGATYQWRFNGADIPGETNASIFAKIPGNYNVITTKFSCKATSAGVNVQQVAPPTPLVNKNGNTLTTAANYISYQWYNNATNPISGETNFYFSPQQTGDYSVLVSNGGCSAMSPLVHFEFDNTGVNNTTGAAAISFYPNPVTDILHIQAPVPVNATVNSVDGKQLITVPYAKDIDISSLPNGIYIIKLTTEDNYLIKVDKIRKVSN